MTSCMSLVVWDGPTTTTISQKGLALMVPQAHSDDGKETIMLKMSRLSLVDDRSWSAPPEAKAVRAILLPFGGQPSWANDSRNCKQTGRSFWEAQGNWHCHSPRSCLHCLHRWCYWELMLRGARQLSGWWKFFSGMVRSQTQCNFVTVYADYIEGLICYTASFSRFLFLRNFHKLFRMLNAPEFHDSIDCIIAS